MPYLSVFKGQASNVCGSSKRMRARLNNKSNTIFVVVVVVVEFFLLILTSAVCVRVPLFLLYHSKSNTHFISFHVDFDFYNQIVCENQQQQKKTYIYLDLDLTIDSLSSQLIIFVKYLSRCHSCSAFSVFSFDKFSFSSKI